MNRTLGTAIATFYLTAIAGIAMAATVDVPVDARAGGRAMMVDAQYRLAMDLRR